MPTPVDRERALRQLPDAYARALRLRDAGSSETEIAARLELEPEAIGPLLEVAEAKLAAAIKRQRSRVDQGLADGS
ncbi:hypothetical protein [Microlunatus sp. GCM10028923]|uniref:hypothetical protein n=1 Tax=Microlunatus sp. GCM10028923 TaxID=3273400 RepID=UPI00361D2CA3